MAIVYTVSDAVNKVVTVTQDTPRGRDIPLATLDKNLNNALAEYNAAATALGDPNKSLT